MKKVAPTPKKAKLVVSGANLKAGASLPRNKFGGRKARAFVGTSGFIYDHWGNGVFYPEGIPQRKWLEYYAGYFDTVELNVAFYRLPSEEAFRSWYKRTPKGFTFALKGSSLSPT